jgi:hypothetical protein
LSVGSNAQLAARDPHPDLPPLRGKEIICSRNALHAVTIQKHPHRPRLSSKKIRIKSQSQLRPNESNKQRRKSRVGSRRRSRLMAFLEITPPGELKEFISLDQGTSTGDG